MNRVLNFKNRRGFTLIELMVVIGIIGLLSGIVLASVNSARESGRITSLIQFDTNIKHTIGDQLVGEWTFDNINSPTWDSSGFGNNGSTIGNLVYQQNGGYNKKGSYLFDGSSAAVRILVPISSSVNFSKRNIITETAWINPRAVGNDRHIIGRQQGPSDASGDLRLANYQVQFLLALNGGGNTTFTSKGSVSLNKWSHIAVSYDGSSVKFYINGVLDSEYPASGSINSNATPIQIGCASNNGGCFSGIIDDVRIYTSSLTALGIQQLYAEDLPDHQDLALIK